MMNLKFSEPIQIFARLYIHEGKRRYEMRLSPHHYLIYSMYVSLFLSPSFIHFHLKRGNVEKVHDETLNLVKK